MDMTSGLITYLGQRFGAVGLLAVVLVAVLIAVVTGLALLAVSELVAASPDPVRVAPVRWVGRF